LIPVTGEKIDNEQPVGTPLGEKKKKAQCIPKTKKKDIIDQWGRAGYEGGRGDPFQRKRKKKGRKSHNRS